MSQSLEPRVILALDFADEVAMRGLVAGLDPALCRLKIGKEMFTRLGPDVVRSLVADGYDVFLDLKFHDIPNTVARACEAAADLGVWMLNVHAMGGAAMMRAAQAAVGDDGPLLIAVTVLTSSGKAELEALGISESPAQMVERLASMGYEAGLDGVVSSAQEAGRIKQITDPGFITVTPGIRPAGSDLQDQKRVMTPAQAVSNGADYLVIGRPITQADDPCKVLRTIASELESDTRT